jgi:3-hydroxyisobutyrate dehydrogenase
MTAVASKVGVLGLGHIGAGVSRTMRQRGFEVFGNDVRPESLESLSGVLTGCPSPRALTEAVDIVFVAVMHDAQVREVVAGEDGILSAAGGARFLVILSTATLDTIRWTAQVCADAGIEVLDCGVSGGAGGLEKGEITAMVGGDEAAFEYVRPALEAFADPVLHMGPLGRGMAAKLARNLLVYTDWSVAWEAARMAQAAGVDVAKFVQAVQASDRYVRGHMALVAEGVGLGEEDEAARGHARGIAAYAEKDLRAVLELGDEYGIDLPAARIALGRVSDVTRVSD